MPRSERAAGLVPFVVMLVLFLAALGWAYGNYTDLDQAKKDKAAADLKLAGKTADLQKLQEEYQVLRDSAGTGDGKVLNTGIEQFITSLRDATKVKFINDTLDIPPGGGRITKGVDGNVVVDYMEGGKAANTYTASDIAPSIIAAFNSIKADLMAFDKRNNELRAQLVKASADLRTAVEAKDAQFEQQRLALQTEISRRDQKIDDVTREKTQAEGDARQARADAETARASEKAAKDEARMALLTMQEEVKRAKQGIEAVRTENPDGEVLASSESTGIVIINRGRKDNLKPGTVFQVYTHGKGGVRVMKGVIRVLSSDESTAKCGLVSGKGIVTGDMIFNRLYHPGKSLRIAVLGRTAKYGTSQAKSILESLGNKIDEKVSMHTDYLLVGMPDDDSDITQSDDYKEALRFGVQIITERDLELFTNY